MFNVKRFDCTVEFFCPAWGPCSWFPKKCLLRLPLWWRRPFLFPREERKTMCQASAQNRGNVHFSSFNHLVFAFSDFESLASQFLWRFSFSGFSLPIVFRSQCSPRSPSSFYIKIHHTVFLWKSWKLMFVLRSVLTPHSMATHSLLVIYRSTQKKAGSWQRTPPKQNRASSASTLSAKTK